MGMGLLGLVIRLPILPVQGFLRLAETLEAEAERQLHDPARVRHELEEAEHAYQAGAISEDELSQVEYQAVARLSSGHAPTGRGPTGRPSVGGAPTTRIRPDSQIEGDQHG